MSVNAKTDLHSCPITICNMISIDYWTFTTFSSFEGEDLRVLSGGAQGVAVVGAILSWQPRLSLRIVTLPSLEMVVTVILFESVTVSETTVSRSTQMELVSGTATSEGGATGGLFIDFEALVGAVLLIEAVIGAVLLIEAIVGAVLLGSTITRVESVLGLTLFCRGAITSVEGGECPEMHDFLECLKI